MLYLKTGPEILAALTTGVIDAGIISAPVTLKARQAGFKEIVNVPERNIPMIHAGLATTRDFVKEHRDRVRGFLQGFMEAVRYSAINPKETKQIIGTFTKTTNQDDLEETYQTLYQGLGAGPLCFDLRRAVRAEFHPASGSKVSQAGTIY